MGHASFLRVSVLAAGMAAALSLSAATAQGAIAFWMVPQTPANAINPVTGGQFLVDFGMSADDQGMLGFSTQMQADSPQISIDIDDPRTIWYGDGSWWLIEPPLWNLVNPPVWPGPSGMIGLGLTDANGMYNASLRVATIVVNIAPGPPGSNDPSLHRQPGPH